MYYQEVEINTFKKRCAKLFFFFFNVRVYTGSAKYLFFGKCFKKTTEYFLKFLFSLESTILSVNNGK